MLLKNLLVQASICSLAFADYYCVNKSGSFAIKSSWAQDAMKAGGTKQKRSGMPHPFHGGPGKDTNGQVKFYGADKRCNAPDPSLIEYPVHKDGHPFDGDTPRDQSTDIKTPARVVYLSDGTTLCGVMTHVLEGQTKEGGASDFRVCDTSPQGGTTKKAKTTQAQDTATSAQAVSSASHAATTAPPASHASVTPQKTTSKAPAKTTKKGSKPRRWTTIAI